MSYAKMFALVALLAIAPAVNGQAPTTPPAVSGPAGTYFTSVSLATAGPIPIAGTISGPAGEYKFILPAGTTIVQTATGYTITYATPAVPLLAPIATPAAAHPLMPR